MLHILLWLNVKFNIQLFQYTYTCIRDGEDKMAINLFIYSEEALSQFYTCMYAKSNKETTISLQSGRHYVLDRSPLDVANNCGLYDRRKL